LPEVVAEISNSATATVGKIRVEPGSSNVVPKKTIFTIDFRDIDADKLVQICEAIQNELELLKHLGFMVNYNLTASELPIDLDRNLVDLCESTVKDMGIPYVKMNSGAGHDAQIFAERFPSSLIFIPCKDGRSHSPVEFASNEDVLIAVEVLGEILRKLAW
jgi:acetylornithine deacetylase/succinyl-diaminopimelate desuccinylase-like protein